MNSDDRSFFSKLIDKIDIHLKETCKELVDLKLEFTEFKTEVKSYLELNEKNKKNKRELILVICTVIASTAAVVSWLDGWRVQ